MAHVANEGHHIHYTAFCALILSQHNFCILSVLKSRGCFRVHEKGAPRWPNSNEGVTDQAAWKLTNVWQDFPIVRTPKIDEMITHYENIEEYFMETIARS